MQKKRIVCALCVLFLLWPIVASAVDLPIDIDVIGQIDAEGGRREAVTARFGIDLFSPAADEVNLALENQFRMRQLRVTLGMFRSPFAHQEVDVEAETLRAAQESDLFAQPMQAIRAVAVEAEETFSTWLIVVIMLCAAGLGFLIARAMGKRREQEDNVSHFDA